MLVARAELLMQAEPRHKGIRPTGNAAESLRQPRIHVESHGAMGESSHGTLVQGNSVIPQGVEKIGGQFDGFGPKDPLRIVVFFQKDVELADQLTINLKAPTLDNGRHPDAGTRNSGNLLFELANFGAIRFPALQLRDERGHSPVNVDGLGLQPDSGATEINQDQAGLGSEGQRQVYIALGVRVKRPPRFDL